MMMLVEGGQLFAYLRLRSTTITNASAPTSAVAALAPLAASTAHAEAYRSSHAGAMHTQSFSPSTIVLGLMTRRVSGM